MYERLAPVKRTENGRGSSPRTRFPSLSWVSVYLFHNHDYSRDEFCDFDKYLADRCWIHLIFLLFIVKRFKLFYLCLFFSCFVFLCYVINKAVCDFLDGRFLKV